MITNDNYGYLLEGLPMHPSLFFPFFPNNQDKFDDFIESYNYWSGGIVLTSDTSSGSIINKNPQHLWDYNLNDTDHSNLGCFKVIIDILNVYLNLKALLI